MMSFETGTPSSKSGQIVEWNANNGLRTSKDMEPKSAEIISTVDPTIISLGAPEKGQTTSAIKVRKKTMTSVYLKFFETAADGKTRSCKFCKQSYSIATATGNLGRHLSHRHPGYDKVGDPITNGNTAQLSPVSVIKKHQSQAGSKPGSVDLDHLNWLLLRWLIGGSHPPSILENQGLANSFKFVNSMVKIWPTERFQAVIVEVFRSMREDVRTSLEQVRSKISITLDFWTSYEQVFYMSVTGHWIDENWGIHKVLLDICHIPSCGGPGIYHTLMKVLKMFNIEKRILCCTHDNSQNAQNACHTLSKEDMDGRKTGSFCYIPCAARMLNVIIEEGLKPAKPVLSKIREFSLVVNTSLEIAEDFRQITLANQEGFWKLPIDTSARWSGSYTMLDIIRKAGKSVDAVIRKHEDSLASRNMLISPIERTAINHVHAYLEPFYKTTNNISTSKLPTIGLVLFFMDHVVEMIASCRDSRQSPDWLKSTAEEMAKKARSYNSQVYNVFTYMAAMLDPRIKGELVPENLNSESNLEDAKSHFLRNYSNQFSVMANGYNTQENECGGVSFAEEIARKRRKINTSTSSDEFTQYLSEPPAPFTTDVLDWWRGNATRYPKLSVMARDFLAMQATSVSPGELFCAKGDEIDKQRICLPHACMQVILCTRSWTDSGFKLRYRSTEIDYDRLMESASAVADNGVVLSGDKVK